MAFLLRRSRRINQKPRILATVKTFLKPALKADSLAESAEKNKSQTGNLGACSFGSKNLSLGAEHKLAVGRKFQ